MHRRGQSRSHVSKGSIGRRWTNALAMLVVFALMSVSLVSVAGTTAATAPGAFVPRPAGVIAGSISGSGTHVCAIKTDGTPVCWGDADDGMTTIPAGLGTVTAIAAGFNQTCVIKTDGTPMCWGNNDAGETTIPAGLGTVSAITAGSYHTCAIKTDGTAVCWGDNTYGQTSIPAGLGTVSAIAAGALHTCAIKTDGTPLC